MAYAPPKPTVNTDEELHPDVLALKAAGLYKPTAADFAASGAPLSPKYPSLVGANPNPGGDALATASSALARPAPGLDPRPLAPVPAAVTGAADPDAQFNRAYHDAWPGGSAGPNAVLSPVAPPHPDSLAANGVAPPMVGPPTAMDSLREARIAHDLRDRGDILRLQFNDAMANHGGAYNADHQAMARQRLEGTIQRDLINTATRSNTATLVGSDEEARKSGADLFQGGHSMAGQRILEINAKLDDPRLPPEQRSALEREFAQQVQVRDQFARMADARRSGSDGLTAASVNEGRTASAAGAQGVSDQAARLAMAGEDRAALRRHAGSAIETAQAGEAVAKAQGAEAEAKLGADPQAIEARRAAELAAQQAAASQAQAGAVQAGTGLKQTSAAAKAADVATGAASNLVALEDPQFKGNLETVAQRVKEGPSWTGFSDAKFSKDADALIAAIASRPPEEQAALKEHLRQSLDLRQRGGLQGLGGSEHWKVVAKLREFVGA